MPLLSILIRYLFEIAVIVTICAYFNHVMWGIGFDFLICLFAFIQAPAIYGKIFWILFFIFTILLIYRVLSIPARFSSKTQQRINHIEQNTINHFRQILPYMNLPQFNKNNIDTSIIQPIFTNNKVYTKMYKKLINRLNENNLLPTFNKYCRSDGLDTLRFHIDEINDFNLMPQVIPQISNYDKFSSKLNAINKSIQTLHQGNVGENKLYDKLIQYYPKKYVIPDLNLPLIYKKA